MPHLKINRKLEHFLTKPKQLKIAIGGRGSGKSIGIGDALTFKMATEKADVYCLREFQDSISDSVHRVFEGAINDRLMLNGWNVQEKRIISPDGAQTAYKGASRNPNSIQSAQGYKYSWFEEAQTMSQASIDKLLPTLTYQELSTIGYGKVNSMMKLKILSLKLNGSTHVLTRIS